MMYISGAVVRINNKKQDHQLTFHFSYYKCTVIFCWENVKILENFAVRKILIFVKQNGVYIWSYMEYAFT